MRLFSMPLYIRLHADYNNAGEPCNTNGTNAWFRSKSGWVKLLINTAYFVKCICKWWLAIVLIGIADSLFKHKIGVFAFCRNVGQVRMKGCMNKLFSFIRVLDDFLLLLFQAGALVPLYMYKDTQNLSILFLMI